MEEEAADIMADLEKGVQGSLRTPAFTLSEMGTTGRFQSKE